MISCDVLVVQPLAQLNGGIVVHLLLELRAPIQNFSVSSVCWHLRRVCRTRTCAALTFPASRTFELDNRQLRHCRKRRFRRGRGSRRGHQRGRLFLLQPPLFHCRRLLRRHRRMEPWLVRHGLPSLVATLRRCCGWCWLLRRHHRFSSGIGWPGICKGLPLAVLQTFFLLQGQVQPFIFHDAGRQARRAGQMNCTRARSSCGSR